MRKLSANEGIIQSRGIHFVEKNTTQNPEYMEELIDKGSSTVPTVIFEDKLVIGLRPKLMNRLLDEAGL